MTETPNTENTSSETPTITEETSTEGKQETVSNILEQFNSPLPFMESKAPAEPTETHLEAVTPSKEPEKEDISKPLPELETFILGDEIYEVPKDAKIPVKIAGEVHEIPLADLKRDFAGKQYYAKKLSEVDLQRQRVEREKGQIEETLKGLYELSAKEPLIAMSLGYEASGLSPKAALKQVYTDIVKEAAKFVQMDDKAQEEYIDRKLYEVEKKGFEGQKKKVESQKTQIQVETWAQSELVKRGKTVSDFELALAKMAEFSETNPEFKIDPNLPPEEQIKKVLSFIDDSDIFIQVAQIAEGYNAPKEVLFSVFETIRKEGLSPSEADYFFKELLGSKDRKVEATPSTPKPGPRKEETKVPERREKISFSTLPFT
jgi:hypothetical protein